MCCTRQNLWATDNYGRIKAWKYLEPATFEAKVRFSYKEIINAKWYGHGVRDKAFDQLGALMDTVEPFLDPEQKKTMDRKTFEDLYRR